MAFDFWMVREPALGGDWRPPLPEAPRYLHLDSRAMPLVVAAMKAAGVLDGETRLPDVEEIWRLDGLEAGRAAAIRRHLEDGQPLDPPLDACERARLDAARARAAALLATASPKPGLVPAFKFASNDGWRVSETEAGHVAAAMQRLLEPPRDELRRTARRLAATPARLAELVERWAAFNRAAAGAGGYSVQ